MKAKWDAESKSTWFAWGVEGTDLVTSAWKKMVTGEESEVSVASSEE